MEIDIDFEEIARRYNEHWPTRPPLIYSNGWLYGMWMIGNDYRNKSTFYGAYPNSLLKRYSVMFDEDYKEILHLFSGGLEPGNYIRFDLEQECEVSGDAHKLSEYFPENKFDIIYADPPYSNEDAEKYGTPMVKRNTVVKECHKILKPGGILVWLDTVYPMYSKKELLLKGTIGLIRSTNHRFRVVCIYQKVE